MQGVFCGVCTRAPPGIAPKGTDPAAAEPSPLSAAGSAQLTRTLPKFVLSCLSLCQLL